MNSVLKDNGQSDVFLKLGDREMNHLFSIYSMKNQYIRNQFYLFLGSGLTPDQLCLAAPVNINDFLLE